MNDQERQSIVDNEHLRLLSIGYIVQGVVAALTSIAGGIYVLFGATILFASQAQSTRSDDRAGAAVAGGVLMAVGLAFVAGFLLYALFCFLSARALRNRGSKWACYVAAIPSLVMIPWGTILGVMTFVVLSRESVRERLEQPVMSPA